MLVISQRNTHVSLLEAILINRNSSLEGNIREMTATVILIEVVRPAVVRNEEIEMAIVVEV